MSQEGKREFLWELVFVDACYNLPVKEYYPQIRFNKKHISSNINGRPKISSLLRPQLTFKWLVLKCCQSFDGENYYDKTTFLSDGYNGTMTSLMLDPLSWYLLLSNFVKQVLNPPAAEQWVCWNPRTSEKHFSPETETEISSERDFPEYAGRVNWKLNKMETQFLLMGIFFLKEKILKYFCGCNI